MQEYASVVRDIDTIHKERGGRGAAALKALASKVKHLLKEQTGDCEKKARGIEAFYRQELHDREEALAKAEARTDALLAEAKQEIQRLLSGNV